MDGTLVVASAGDTRFKIYFYDCDWTRAGVAIRLPTRAAASPGSALTQ
jgi:hypothetical protein